jgi:transposase
MNQTTLQMNRTTEQTQLYLSLELSAATWKLTCSDGAKLRQVNVEPGNFDKLDGEIQRARAKFGLPANCGVCSCYEAGRDGFWLHRELDRRGIRNLVVDPTSIEVDRRQRHAKTDGIDGRKLAVQLVRYLRGDRGALRSVRVPTREEEDARRPERERQRLKKECVSHSNRIRSLLVLHGIRLKWPAGLTTEAFAKGLDVLNTPANEAVPRALRSELVREYARLRKVREQLDALEDERKKWVREEKHPWAKKVAKLTRLRGVGEDSSRPLVAEFFGWRQFKNRRELGSAAGFTPTPFDSGGSKREQGISKAGNPRIRSLMVELAWSWLRYQPESRVALWFQKRFANGGARARRIGIVAVARRLLIALWRWLEQGLVPDGAQLKAA